MTEYEIKMYKNYKYRVLIHLVSYLDLCKKSSKILFNS